MNPSSSPTVSTDFLSQVNLFLTAFGLVIGGGGILSIYKYIRSRQRKEISFSIVTDSTLANIHDSIIGSNDVKILVNDRRVNNIRLVTLRLKNIGNVPIKQEDYEIPLCFLKSELLESGQLINAQIVGAEPADLVSVASFYNDGTNIGINKLLLNNGDAVYINLLLADYADPIHVYGRIVGVKEIKQEKFIQRQPFNFGSFIGQVIAVVIVSVFFAGILAFPLSFWFKIPYFLTTAVTAITIGGIIFIWYLIALLKRLFEH